MRTPRLFLGIFALALLLPLLLLACGGSDEPADGPSSELATAAPTDLPDSERATDEPEDRASSGQTPPEPTPPEPDREALVALYNATGGPNWIRNNNWLSDAPISEWEGVTTDGNGRVIELWLDRNELSGEIPPEFGNLANLIELYLFRNQLTGEIPPELGNLANLTWLDLDGNQFSGEIPPELGNLANLTGLGLSGDGLSGGIPPELGNLANLTSLYIQQTQLSGGIPPELGNLANLKHMYLIWNQLSGEIPPELGNLANLTRLGLSNNELSGEIPRELGNLANLTVLGLGRNQLSGKIPPELGSFANLIRLGLNGNQLRGEIPPEFGNLAHLQFLGLDGNQLSGEIPPEFGNLAHLQFLGLDGNQLSGCVPSSLSGRLDLERSDLGGLPLCPSPEADRNALVAFYNATGGPYWNSNDNWLSDVPISEWAGVTTDGNGRVTQLWFDGNQLSGEIPPGLGNLANLAVMGLGWNQLSGEIPPELGNLANLELLWLVRNQLSGEIPPELGNLANLKWLHLEGNQLSGCVPSSLSVRLDMEESDLGGLPPCPAATAEPMMAQTPPETDREALVALYSATGGPNWIRDNNWLSDVPISEWEGVATDANGRVTELDLEGNELSGEIPPEFGNLANLIGLDLDGNQLSGEIPPELGNLANLEFLGLDGNELSGEIPPELGNLANLEFLGLDGNELSGEIPPEFGNLSNLTGGLYLGGNQLSGCVPNYLSGRLDMERSDLGDLQFCRAWGEPSKRQPTTIPAAIGFAECIPEDLYHHLLSIDAIENLEDLRTVNWAPPAELGSVYIPEICQTVDVVLTAGEEPKVFNDNVFVLPIPGDLVAEQPLDPTHYTSRFYEYFDDEFDFLIFVTSLHQFVEQRLGGGNPQYYPVSNGVRGIGTRIFSNAQKMGSGGRLQGLVRLPTYRTMAHQEILLHELMHRWGAYITGSLDYHWAFSSTHGILGGFDIADLMDLGDGDFAVRHNWLIPGVLTVSSPTDVYSPIELYVAGFMPPGGVPDLWVGEDVEWVRDQSGDVSFSSGRYSIFKPGTVRSYTIEEIIAEHGERIPDSSRSQKDFRAAVVMLIDENHPATKWQLDQLSSYVAAFSFPGESRDGMYNFYEATGGRGTIAMGELSEFLKGGSEP